jgi:hypothetical protein
MYFLIPLRNDGQPFIIDWEYFLERVFFIWVDNPKMMEWFWNDLAQWALGILRSNSFLYETEPS